MKCSLTHRVVRGGVRPPLPLERPLTTAARTRLLHTTFTHGPAPQSTVHSTTVKRAYYSRDTRYRICYQKLVQVFFVVPKRTEYRTRNVHARDQNCALWLVNCVGKVSGTRNLSRTGIRFLKQETLCKFLVHVTIRFPIYNFLWMLHLHDKHSCCPQTFVL